MGQLLSRLWWWSYSRLKYETPRDDDYHQADCQTNLLDDNQITSLYINIPENNCQPISSSSTTQNISNHDTSLDPSTTHVVVHLSSACEEEKAKKKGRRKKKKEPIIDDGDQVIPKQISGKNVSTTIPHDSSHYINIPDHHIPTIPTSSTAKNIGNHDSSLVPSPRHMVVDLNKACEEEKAKKKQRRKKNKQPIFDNGYQVIPKQVSGINVATTISRVTSVRKIGHYNCSQKLLLVGEGDFSFSACLAVAFGNSAVNITATSLNSEGFLRKNYEKFITNKAKLECRGSRVLHEVNATKMVKHPSLDNLVFDRIIFNFPHTGQFGHSETEMRSHQKLIRGFLRNAKKMVGEDGEIHITAKSNGFFLEWNIPKMGSDHGLKLLQEVKFQRSMYPGYNTKYGFGEKIDSNFDCNPSTTYMFGRSLK